MFQIILCGAIAAVLLLVLVFGPTGLVIRPHSESAAPRRTVEAEVTARRTAGDEHYVTFRMQGGERIELPVTAVQYSQMAEGDLGRLTLQGRRYLEFRLG